MQIKCRFSATLTIQRNYVNNEVESLTFRQVGSHCHNNEEEYDETLNRAKYIAMAAQRTQAFPGVKAPQAIYEASGAPVTEKDVRQVSRKTCALRIAESTPEEIREYFQENDFWYSLDNETVIWSSPGKYMTLEPTTLNSCACSSAGMRRSAQEFQDPLFIDATHSIPVASGEALLHVVSYLDKNNNVRALAMALSFVESSSDAQKVLRFVNKVLGYRPPAVVFSDSAQGYKAAVKAVFPAAFHRGCSFHVIRSFSTWFRNFGCTDKRSEAEYLLRKVICTVDPGQSAEAWRDLRNIITEECGNAADNFLAYYEKHFQFWTVVGMPRALYLGQLFANSPAESVNSKVKRSNAHKSPSLIRTISALSKSFDDDLDELKTSVPRKVSKIPSTLKWDSKCYVISCRRRARGRTTQGQKV